MQERFPIMGEASPQLKPSPAVSKIPKWRKGVIIAFICLLFLALGASVIISTTVIGRKGPRPFVPEDNPDVPPEDNPEDDPPPQPVFETRIYDYTEGWYGAGRNDTEIRCRGTCRVNIELLPVPNTELSDLLNTNPNATYTSLGIDIDEEDGTWFGVHSLRALTYVRNYEENQPQITLEKHANGTASLTVKLTKDHPMVPLYHYYNNATEDTILTIDPFEVEDEDESGYVLKGQDGFCSQDQIPHTVPLYRLNGNKGHFYTVSESEKADFPSYNMERIECYVFREEDAAASVAIHRFLERTFSYSKDEHEKEREYYQGVAFYLSMNDTVEVDTSSQLHSFKVSLQTKAMVDFHNGTVVQLTVPGRVIVFPYTTATPTYTILDKPEEDVPYSEPILYVQHSQEEIYFNNAPEKRKVMRVSITGETVHLDDTKRRILDGSLVDNIEELSIVADTITVSVPLWLPSTRLKLKYRILQFDDGLHEAGYAKIDTTPKGFMFPAELSQPGLRGIDGPEHHLISGSIKQSKNAKTRFIMKGGPGQVGGHGADGENGLSVPLMPPCLVPGYGMHGGIANTVSHTANGRGAFCKISAIGMTLHAVRPSPPQVEKTEDQLVSPVHTARAQPSIWQQKTSP